jgi:hypothetical protein
MKKQSMCYRSMRALLRLLTALPICVASASETPQPAPTHPALAHAPTRAYTRAGVPGDPINIAFVGSEDDLLRTMAAAHWDPADPITLRSSLRITVDSIARRAYVDAPVSTLLVDGRKQDLAFEQPAARGPSKRHHVRFWRIDSVDELGRPLWIGAATYDVSIGVSHTGWHVTHHIAADIDDERDKLLSDIQNGGGVAVTWLDDFQPDRAGRNGGGDPYRTDGRLAIVTTREPPLK